MSDVPAVALLFGIDIIYKKWVLNGDNLADANFKQGFE